MISGVATPPTSVKAVITQMTCVVPKSSATFGQRRRHQVDGERRLLGEEDEDEDHAHPVARRATAGGFDLARGALVELDRLDRPVGIIQG